jgi:type VI secretion system protein ImpM
VTAAPGAGFHGKIPARGDFVSTNLPSAFLEPWDAWLQAGIAASRNELGDRWLPLYLESPIWRFVLSAGACGPLAWAGVLMPSVDKVGRYFPLTIARPLPRDASAIESVTASEAWFEHAEKAAMRALDDDRLDIAAFSADVAALGDAAAAAPEVRRPGDAAGSVAADLSAARDRLVVERVAVYSIWWTGTNGNVAARMFVTPRLPAAERFVDLLTGPASEGGAPSPDS